MLAATWATRPGFPQPYPAHMEPLQALQALHTDGHIAAPLVRRIASALRAGPDWDCARNSATSVPGSQVSHQGPPGAAGSTRLGAAPDHLGPVSDSADTASDLLGGPPGTQGGAAAAALEGIVSFKLFVQTHVEETCGVMVSSIAVRLGLCSVSFLHGRVDEYKHNGER